MKLDQQKIGKTVTVVEVGGQGALRQHFLDMGVIPGAAMTVVKLAPMGDPMELRVQSYNLTLRKDDARLIKVENLEVLPESAATSSPAMVEHPGLGEEGKYHVKRDEHPLFDDEKLTFALVGNQNCGKTTLFNQLTGSNQHVGNFPGVTVEGKSGAIRNKKNTEVTDLPGIYSLSPYSSEEVITRNFILDSKPKGIINIVDATNIERNLYLTMQLMELGVPMVLALNMMDEVRGNGGSVRINQLEGLLGIPVVPISAAKGEGIEELVSHAIHVAHYQEKPGRMDFCDKNDHGGAVHRCLHGIMDLIEDHADGSGIPLRFAATKLVEGDSSVLEAMKLAENEKKMLEHIIVQMEKERGMDRTAAIADMRFSFIRKVAAQTVTKPSLTKEQKRSEKVDRILTGKYTAIPLFISIMGLIFYLTFNVIGAWLQRLLEIGIETLSGKVEGALVMWGVNDAIRSLVIDGIFGGVGSVLSFFPIIVTLFFFLSMLEDTGYMARVAFVMDKALRKIGLSGRSIVPMLIGFGCTVPAVMATRTLSSSRDRRMTILLTPFMSCSAKLPIYGFFVSAFFPGHGALIMISLYVLGMLLAVITALVSKKLVFKGEAVPFVMEMPSYRMPSPRSVMMLLWDKAKDFLERAFSIIFLATIAIWSLQSFDFHLNLIEDSSLSILSRIAGFIAPMFSPLGFGDWRIAAALFTGFIAKESVVSTISVLLGASTAITSIISPLAALSLLVFCLLYTPCIAAVAAVKREEGAGWAMLMIVFQCTVAWLCSFLVHLIFLAIV